MKIRIIDTKSPYCGQEFDGHLVYYDYYHGKKVVNLADCIIKGKESNV